MNNTFERLLDGMCATLRSEVLSRIDDEFARGQVYGVINLLNTFKVRADWSTAFLAQQIDAQRQALTTSDEILRRSSVATQAPKTRIPDAPVPTPVAEMLAARDQGNQSIGDLLAWLHDNPAARQVSAEDTAALQQALRGAMRAEVDLELKYASRPMFAEMSGAAES